MSRFFHLSRGGKHWVVSLTAGFLILLLLLLGVTFGAIRMMKQTKLQEYSENIVSMQRNMDRFLLTLNQVTVELMLNNQNAVLQEAGDPSTFISPDAYRFSDLIHNIKTANPFVEDMYLYYPAHDYVVGAEGCYSSLNYYLLSNSLSCDGYDAWRDDVLSANHTGFFFSLSASGQLQLYLRQQLSLNAGGEHASVALLCVNGDEFASLLEAMRPTDAGTAAAVFTRNGQLYRGGELPVPQALSEWTLTQAEGVQEIQVDSLIGWQAASSLGDFYYVVAGDLSVLLASIRAIQRLLVIAILLCTVIGVFTSLLLSWKHYAPIEKTLRRLSVRHSAEMDYYEFERRVNELIQENENVARLNERMLWTLKKNVLADILTQRVTDAGSIEMLLQSNGITLDYAYFRLLLADVSFEPDETRVLHWLFRASDVFEHEYSSMEVIPTSMAGSAVFLLNYETSGQSEIQRLREIFLAECRHPAKMWESDEFMAAGQIVPVWEQTRLQAAAHSGAAGKRGLDDGLILERWQKVLLLREYSGAAALVHDLFREYVSAADPYLRMSRSYTVAGCVLQAAKDQDQRHGTAYYNGYLQLVKSATGTDSLPDRLKDILLEMELHSSQHTQNQPARLAPRIKKIIEDNYDQPYLGLYYIADQVKVSTSYVSKVFKSEYGIGVVEYVNRLRIDGAKRLLETKELTIREIAEQVGFTSDIHFIRIFKKYEHTTPGVYQRQRK